MKKTLLAICIYLGLHQIKAQTTYSKEIEEQIKKVENSLGGQIRIEGKEVWNISDRMAQFKVKGLSIAVIQNYKIVWAKGYGWADEQEKRAVTPQTLFEPGSISKSLNAVGLLKLVQDKKLDLHTDINTYLRSWKFPYDSVSHGKKITLAHLLSHSAGLTVHGFPGYNRFIKLPTVPEVLDGKTPANTPPVRSAFEPGLKFQYSGGGTTISQLILADVTQTPYDRFIAANVFKPMGMDNTFFTQPPPADKLKLVATGYREDGSTVVDKFHVYPEQGAAGLWTTPSDLCKYIIETQLAYEGKSAKVLNQEMTKLRLTPYLDNSAALGIFIDEINGLKYFQHGAGNEGFRGQYYGSMEGGNGVAVFVNSDNGNILWEVINSVASVYDWKGFYNPVTKKEIKVSEKTLQNYAGVYMHMEGRFTVIVKKEDGYYLFADGTYYKMYFSTETDFFNLEIPTEKHFITDASGKVSGYSRSLKGKPLSPGHVKVSDPDTLTGSENFFNIIGWTFLENKNYDEAIRYLKRGLSLHPKALLIEGNLAHCYLFKNDYASAIKIYKMRLKQPINGSATYTWDEMIKQDFVFFKNNGFDKKLMDKVFAELNLEVPEGYKH